MRIGGSPESYMEAPTLDGNSGGPSFIASILDLLGINKQVANGGKSKAAKGKDSGGGGNAKTEAAAPPPDKTAMQNGAMYDSHGHAAADGWLAGLDHGLRGPTQGQYSIAPPNLPAWPTSQAVNNTGSFMDTLRPMAQIDPNSMFGR